MCGIAGIYNVDGLMTDGERILKEMLRSIRHRGPNEAGLYLADKMAMGTVRLSIIGVKTGQQPVCDESERYYLCYNGEVYNYLELRNELQRIGLTFHTESDTEVVLRAWQAWGADCLSRFNGAFGFALYDRMEQVLYLVRDAFGKRPLYYVRHKNSIYFSSEMKSFFSIPDFYFELDSEQLSSILTLWTPLPHQSGFRGIEQVPQGSYLKIDYNQTEIKRYYQVDFRCNYSFDTESEAEDAVVHALSEAVKLRLRSDVEVGVYLSGGLDSSILSTLVSAQNGAGFRSYSVAFDDEDYDESREQKLMSSHINSRHCALQVNDEAIVNNFPRALYHAEVPVFRTAFVPMYLLSEKVRDDGIKVVITGEGADEAFLGYNIFKETLMRSEWSSLEDEERLTLLSELYPYLKHYNQGNREVLLGLYQQFSKENYPGLFSHEIRIQNGHFSRRLLKDTSRSLDSIMALIGSHEYFNDLSVIQKAQWLEFQTLLPGYLLSSQGDRMSLSHSVENRCPFLDRNVVELSAAVNLGYDGKSIEKDLLRRAFKNVLPAEIVEKRKMPYRAPDSKAFVSQCPDYLELLFSENELHKVNVLDPKFCSMLSKKVMTRPYDQISTKDNQAFIFLLSLCLLNHQFVNRGRDGISMNPPIDDILVRRLDKRRQVMETF